MIATAIKKGKGIEDLVKPTSIDTVKSIVVDDHVLNSMFVAYREFIRIPIDRAYMRSYIRSTEDPVILTPPPDQRIAPDDNDIYRLPRP